jgi:hypothetical protein
MPSDDIYGRHRMTYAQGYSPDDVAQELRVSRTFVFDALRLGLLERQKVGHFTVIPTASFKAFREQLAQRRGQAPAEAAA